jgi:hypothetical protein
MSYEEYDQKTILCPQCGSEKMRRIIRPIRIARSEENHLDNLSDPALIDSIDEDPRALGKMMREISSEMGEEMGPEFDEVVDRLESGQSPDEIERDLPDLGTGADDF